MNIDWNQIALDNKELCNKLSVVLTAIETLKKNGIEPALLRINKETAEWFSDPIIQRLLNEENIKLCLVDEPFSLC